MAYPIILFNTSTGSDSLSSGAGPLIAINGSGASLNATTTVDLSADSPDLSGVATDGSACLWVQTSSGRQFSQIIATDNSLKTITVNTAYNVTESSRNWAIGGKRATWDNSDTRILFNADLEQNWTIETETDQTLTSAITISVNGGSSGWIKIKGSSDSPRPIITQSGSSEYLFLHPVRCGWQWLENLHFKHSGSTPQYVFGLRNQGEVIAFYNCVCGDTIGGYNPRGLINRLGGYCDCWIDTCEIKYGSGWAVDFNWGSNLHFINNCYIHDNAYGISTKPNGTVFILSNSILVNNGSYGLYTTNGSAPCFIRNNIIKGHSLYGIYLGGTRKSYIEITNNILTDCGSAIHCHPDQDLTFKLVNGNCFFNNSIDLVNVPFAMNSVFADPEFVDPANGNYTTGINVRVKGYPVSDQPIGINSNTLSYVDIGVAQQFTGGSIYHPLNF